jgi:hypothetical protein
VNAEIDALQEVVRVGTTQWPFVFDGRENIVSVTMSGGSFRLRPLLWREKQTLARFAHLGAAFLQRHYLRLCLIEPLSLPAESDEHAALWALAQWINTPAHAKAMLPLNAALLASVTFDLCRAMQRAPGDFDLCAAHEVELLWNAARTTQPTQSGQQTATEEDDGVTRIVVVPEAASPTNPSPDLEEETPTTQTTRENASANVQLPRTPGSSAPLTSQKSASVDLHSAAPPRFDWSVPDPPLTVKETAPRLSRSEAVTALVAPASVSRTSESVAPPRFRRVRVALPTEQPMGIVSREHEMTRATPNPVGLRSIEDAGEALELGSLGKNPSEGAVAHRRSATPAMQMMQTERFAVDYPVDYPVNNPGAFSSPRASTVRDPSGSKPEPQATNETASHLPVASVEEQMAFFEEFAERLEQAAAELGIDVEA